MAFGFWGILSPVWILLLLSTMLPVLVTVIEDGVLYKPWRIVKLRHACWNPATMANLPERMISIS